MQTTWNLVGKLQGSTDIDLSDFGKEQALKLVDVINLDNIGSIYSSDKLRTKFLAERLAAKYHLDLRIDDELREVNVGDWAGSTWDEIKVNYADFLTEWFKDNENIPMPGGESYKQLLNRVLTALNKAVESTDQDIIVVTHGAVIRALVCHVLGMELKSRSRFDVDNGSITCLEYEGKFTLKYLNNTLV